MAKSKKVLSLVLAVVMVLSMFAVNAFAVEADNTADFAVTASTDTLTEGATVTFTVKVGTNYNVGPIGVPIAFDANAFTYVANSVQAADIFGVDATDVTANEANGQLNVVIIPLTANGATTGTLSADATLFTFQLTVKAGVTSGSYTVGIAEGSQKSATNLNGKWYCGSCSTTNPATGTIVTMGQTFTKADATVAFAAAADADLAVKSAYAASGIVIDTNKTFGGKYAGAVYGFTLDATINQAYYTDRLEATNGGSITVVKTPYVSRPVSYGTGATIQVKNADGSVAKTYVVIIFGDVSGNGKIGSEDVGLIYDHTNGVSLLTDEVKIMSANLVETGRTAALKATSLYQIKADDLGVVYNASNAISAITSTTVATAHNTYNTYYQ